MLCLFEIEDVGNGVIILTDAQTRSLDVPLEVTRSALGIQHHGDSPLLVNILSLLLCIARDPPPEETNIIYDSKR